MSHVIKISYTEYIKEKVVVFFFFLKRKGSFFAERKEKVAGFNYTALGFLKLIIISLVNNYSVLNTFMFRLIF